MRQRGPLHVELSRPAEQGVVGALDVAEQPFPAGNLPIEPVEAEPLQLDLGKPRTELANPRISAALGLSGITRTHRRGAMQLYGTQAGLGDQPSLAFVRRFAKRLDLENCQSVGAVVPQVLGEVPAAAVDARGTARLAYQQLRDPLYLLPLYLLSTQTPPSPACISDRVRVNPASAGVRVDRAERAAECAADRLNLTG